MGRANCLANWRRQAIPELTILFHAADSGKGAALRTGFSHATGDLSVIQDAVPGIRPL
jgi:hypothetical protein